MRLCHVDRWRKHSKEEAEEEQMCYFMSIFKQIPSRPQVQKTQTAPILRHYPPCIIRNTVDASGLSFLVDDNNASKSIRMSSHAIAAFSNAVNCCSAQSNTNSPLNNGAPPRRSICGCPHGACRTERQFTQQHLG